MELQFSNELQERIYEQVPVRDRKWLGDAVAYVRSTRRGYPPDDARWNDDTTVDHILYYVTVATSIQKDATLDVKNVAAKIRRYLDTNPCIVGEPTVNDDET